jgi:hypothetical protein
VNVRSPGVGVRPEKILHFTLFRSRDIDISFLILSVVIHVASFKETSIFVLLT